MLIEENTDRPGEDTEVLQLSGTPQTILKYKKMQMDRGTYNYLKINIMGNQVKSFNYGCLYFFIAMISLFLFPIFLICTDCCRRKIEKLFNIDLGVYDAIGAIIAELKPKEVYIVVQDNYFNETKCSAITKGLEVSHINKFQFVNTALGINSYGHNYSDFELYARQWKDMIPWVRARWAKKGV